MQAENRFNLGYQIYPAMVVAKREVRDQLRDWRIIFPVLALTVLFPFLANFAAQSMLDYVNQYGASLIGERLVPFLMMIVGFFPISVSLVIALDSFVGEKERSSIEPLLNTPLKDWQLYLGKLVAATVPPLCASFIGMTVYILGLLWSGVPLPDFGMTMQIITLTIVQAFMMVAGAVVVSTQATSIRSANLLSSFIIIPAAFLIQGESVMMFLGTNSTLWWAVLGLVVLSGLLVRVGLAHFRREEMLGREIDVLNIKWGWSVFRNAFRGEAKNLWQWYRQQVFPSVRKLRIPVLIMLAVAIASIFIGLDQNMNYSIPLDQLGYQDMHTSLERITETIPVGSILPVLAIWWQNLRVLLVGLVLGAISFGILGVMPVIASMGVVGYLMGLLNHNGVSVLQYLVGFILPHGIFEIPAVLLAGAAVLRGGAILAMPDKNKTIGEVWLISLAEWTKIMLGLVMPLLLLGAMVEAWVTPRLALWLVF